MSKLQWKDILELIESEEKSAKTEQILKALNTFLEHNEQHSVVNFYQRIKSGMDNLVDLLLNLRLTKVDRKRFVDTAQALEGLSEGQFVEDLVSQALYVWLREAWNFGLAYVPEEAKDESPSPQRTSNDVSEATPVAINAWESLCPFTLEDIRGPKRNGILEQMQREVQSIDLASITELRSFSNPPQDVKDVLFASFYLLGYKNEEDQNHAWKLFKTNKLNFLQSLMCFNKEALTYKQCRKIKNMMRDISHEQIYNVSKAAVGLYLWIKNMVHFRAILAIEGNEVATIKAKASPKKSKTPKKASKTVKITESAYSAYVNNSDVHNTFAQTSADAKEHSSTVNEVVDRQYTYSPVYDRLGFDWTLFRRDSPIRRRLLRQSSPESKVARNSVQAENKVLNDIRKDPYYHSYSYDLYNYPDLNYMRHRTDVSIDHAIHNERMKVKNINKTKSRVNYHWSPKRRREMKAEGDYMTGFYTERFIKDVIKDIHGRRITFREGEDYLKDFGYDLELNRDPSGVDHIAAVRTADEIVSSETPKEEGQEKVLYKEYLLGKDLIRKAAHHITEESLLDLAHDHLLSYDDQQIVRTFIGLLELVNLGRTKSYPTWYTVQSSLELTRDWIHKIDDFELMIEHYTYTQGEVSEYKENFKTYAQNTSNKGHIINIREFLCEAFCLLDIVNELKAARSSSAKTEKSPAKFERLENRTVHEVKEETKNISSDITQIKESSNEVDQTKSDDLERAEVKGNS